MFLRASIAKMKKRTTRITVETERLLVISGSHAAAATLWCEACQVEVTMLGLDEASALSRLSNRTIFQLAETGEIHFIETAEGKAMFCVPSLRNQTPARGARLLNK